MRAAKRGLRVGLTVVTLMTAGGLARAQPAAPEPAQVPGLMQSICLPYLQGKPIEAAVKAAENAGFGGLSHNGVFTHLKGPAGELSLGDIDGRFCDILLSPMDYPTLLEVFQSWTTRAPGGPYQLKAPPGPDEDGHRWAEWKGRGMTLTITEEFNDDDQLVLEVSLSAKH
jgi:hypothetical protein